MPHCENCDGHVTEQYARVVGDNDDTVHACPACATQRAIYHGAAAQLDVERRVANTQGGMQ
jgi:hypothetical protein